MRKNVAPPPIPPSFKKIAACLLCCAGLGVPAFAADPTWTLVLNEDFNGSYDTDVWSRINKPDREVIPDWRKYMDDTSEDLVEFKTVDGKSCIALKGKKDTEKDTEDASTSDYREAGLYTQSKFSFQYGKVEICAKFDSVQGVWPALWMMPTDGSSWPENGEIDIMEHLNNDDFVYQTLHVPNASGKDSSVFVKPSFDPAEFHTYGIEWAEGEITFYLDGKATRTFTAEDTTSWPFDNEGNEFYLILSMQIGGEWVEGLGTKGIDAEALYKDYANLYIDYVKVYQLIPEPSSFGLLAGTLALAFCASRRRRRRGNA